MSVMLRNLLTQLLLWLLRGVGYLFCVYFDFAIVLYADILKKGVSRAKRRVGLVKYWTFGSSLLLILAFISFY